MNILFQRLFPTKNITRELTAGALLFLFFSIPLFLTLPDYGITFDEPIYMEATRNVRTWLSLDWPNLLNRETIDQYWKTDSLRNVHPSGVKWLYLAAQKIIFWEKDPYTQNRLFNILLLSLSFVLFLRWSLGPSFFHETLGILVLLSIPRFFAHSHFAATDIPMTALLMLFVMVLGKSFTPGWFYLSGIILGFLASIKITSLLIALPVLLLPVAWSGQNRRKALFSACRICFLGAVAFYILNPDWWFSPLTRGTEFLAQTSTRRTWAPFTVYFAGDFYAYRGPFYAVAAMFLITTPLLHLLFLFTGLTFSFVGGERSYKMILILSCLLLPFLITALPLSPTNDGIRYVLPAFPFAACIMVRGLIRCWRWVTTRLVSFPGTAVRAVFAAGCLLLLGFDVYETARLPPFELSYYNRMIGGLPGALRNGYETTYWWEIFNNVNLREVNNRTAGRKVYFPLAPTDLFFKDMGEKIAFVPVVDDHNADFMLILGRPYVTFWEKKTLVSFAAEGKMIKPLWEISVDSVPLLRLYRILAKDG